MTTARKTQVSLKQTPYYHCIARCVRRAWLWGYDEYAGKDFSHRKEWVIDRLRELSSMFALEKLWTPTDFLRPRWSDDGVITLFLYKRRLFSLAFAVTVVPTLCHDYRSQIPGLTETDPVLPLHRPLRAASMAVGL